MTLTPPRDMEAVEEDAARYRALFEGSMDAIYLSREDGRILRVNPAFTALFGYAQAELQDLSAEDFYADPADRRRFKSQIVAHGAVKDFETRLRRQDGQVRTCLITASVRRGVDGAAEYQGIIRDVTERRQEQAELASATEELRRSNRELEQFAYVASHDLQEPLRKVQAFGDRLASVARERLDEQGLDYLRRMLSAAERMQTLIQNLLVYSRISSRRGEFEKVDLGAVMDGIIEDLEPQIQEAGAEVKVGHLPWVQADPLQMRQLFQNLISNALKYRAPGIPPVVEVDAEYLDAEKVPVLPEPPWQAVWTRIRVKDNGIGFEPRYAERIFDLFQRLHGSGEYSGTGIGLGICRTIVRRHGGSIRAEGEPGKGATFEANLPLVQDSGAHDG